AGLLAGLLIGVGHGRDQGPVHLVFIVHRMDHACPARADQTDADGFMIHLSPSYSISIGLNSITICMCFSIVLYHLLSIIIISIEIYGNQWKKRGFLLVRIDISVIIISNNNRNGGIYMSGENI